MSAAELRQAWRHVDTACNKLRDDIHRAVLTLRTLACVENPVDPDDIWHVLDYMTDKMQSDYHDIFEELHSARTLIRPSAGFDPEPPGDSAANEA